MRIDTRTISVSFVVWPLENLEKPIVTIETIVTDEFKGKINWKICIPWKISMKYNSLP